MALYLYYGKIGDGKTHHVVSSEILPAVRDGRKMYVYLDGLSPRRLSQFAGRNADVVMWDKVEDVRAACRLEVDDRDGVGLAVDRGSLIVVDEAQLVWDAREWAQTGKQALAFFEFHRHFGLDVVLITQSPGRLDKGLVRLANECLHVKNLRFLSSALGNRYVVNVRQSPHDRDPVATVRSKFDSNVFACYRSTSALRGSRVHGRGIKGAMLWGPAAAALALILYVRSGGIATLQGQAVKVEATNLSAGGVRSPESWPKPGPELRKVDPPIPGITGDGKSAVTPATAASAAAAVVTDEKVKHIDENPLVGVVEVDGVIRTIRKGDSLLSSGPS